MAADLLVGLLVVPLMLAAFVWFIAVGIKKLETATGPLSPLAQTAIAVVVVFGVTIMLVLAWVLLVG